MKLYKLTLCITILFTFILPARSLPESEKRVVPDSVAHYFARQLYIYPQEKVYAQIDKSTYIAGEDIWFRAYVVNAASHLTDTISRYVYAELVNPQNKLESRVKVRKENGVYQGYLSLNENLPEGDYRLRFYTRYLEGMGKEYFFERNIRVGTLAKSEQEETKGRRKRSSASDSDYHVDFFPEGGNLPTGIISRMTFKALNAKGLGEDISGYILNEKGDTLTLFNSTHLGMGSFSFYFSDAETLQAVCTNKEGVEKRFTLPAAEENVVSLHTSNHRNILYIALAHSYKDGLPDPLTLLITCRGHVLYSKEWEPGRDLLAFPESGLPRGVIHILLMDAWGNPLSERLVFNHADPEPIITSFITDKPDYSAREKVEAVIQFTDSVGVPLKGNFSVAITDDRDVLPDSTVNILSTLLLTSELKGHIEDPGYYFRNNDLQAKQYLDNLLLTQGWTRYEIKDIVKRRFHLPGARRELAMELRGEVKGGVFMNRKAKGFPVSAYSIRPFFYLSTETDDEGKFLVDYFEVPDSITLLVQAKTPKGGKWVEILVEEERFPEMSRFVPLREEQKDSSLFDQYLQKADHQLLFTKGIRTIHLSDVVVTASKVPERGKSGYSSSFNERYSREYIEEQHATTIFDLLQRMPGVIVQGDKVSFSRNMGSSMSGNSQALILVDDIPFDNEFVSTINVHDIEEIELVKGPGAAIFGMRGGNGAILITTRRGEGGTSREELSHIKTISPLGFQITKEFYSPVYETVEVKDFINPDLRTTLYWNPYVPVGEDGKATFGFYTAEPFTTYSVILEGITEDGRIIHLQEKITGRME